MRLPSLLIGVLCGACGASPGTPDAGCQVTWGGNYAATVTAPGCASLSQPADGGGSVLDVAVPAMTGDSVQLEVQIDLGASPAAGDLSSENVSDWSAVGISARNNCSYSAGTASVPQGNFSLTLTSVTATQAHGTLHLEQYVHAPPAVDCGPGDVETVDLAF